MLNSLIRCVGLILLVNVSSQLFAAEFSTSEPVPHEKTAVIVYGFNVNNQDTVAEYSKLRVWLKDRKLFHEGFWEGFNCMPLEDLGGTGLLTISCVLNISSVERAELNKLVDSAAVVLKVEKILHYGIEYSRHFADLKNGRARDSLRHLSFADYESFELFDKKFVLFSPDDSWDAAAIESYFRRLIDYLNDPYMLFDLKQMAKEIDICAFQVNAKKRVMTETGWKDLYVASRGSVPNWELGQNWTCWGDISKIFANMK